MAELIIIVAGILLIGLAFVDALATTLVVGAAGGPLTERLTGWAWRGYTPTYERRVAGEADRRDRLSRLVRSDGWSWPQGE